MKVLSINLKPNPSENGYAIEGTVVIDSIPVSGIIKIELEVDPLGPSSAISGHCGGSGTVSNYYALRIQLKNSQINPISNFREIDNPCLRIPIEDLHRFSGFLDSEA